MGERKMGQLEFEKQQLVGKQNIEEHKQKMEREDQRHKHVMEELQFMADNKITAFTRRDIG
jgi:hypothetical protein